ncbi:MAG: DUF2911 domain-containing protein [Saprospiraceae bacterium]|nr:DUF2911 domain-containing protein [Saprospiraceae bacterium]
MKFISGLFLFTTCLFSGLVLNAQIKTPAASPSSTVKSTVGLGEVTIEYSRPSMKGRTIFGDLVPFGKLWRTGANSATKVTFSDAATVGTTELAKGTYAIYTIPNPNDWTVIFYKDLTKGGGLTDANINADDVAAKFVVRPATINPAVETFTFDITDLSNNGASIAIMWDKTLVKVPFTYKTDEAVMANIKAKMAGPSGDDYFAAARYYFESGKDLKQALEWIKKSTDMNGERFWVLRQQSLVEAKLGMFADAIKSAERSLSLAKAANSDDYVKMNTESIKEWKTKK